MKRSLMLILKLIRIAAATCLLAYVSSSQAIPLRLDAAQFATRLSQASSIAVEDFEGFAPGNKSNPFTFSNGTFTDSPGGTGPPVDNPPFVPSVVRDAEFCGPNNPQCLTTDHSNDRRTFSGF